MSETSQGAMRAAISGIGTTEYSRAAGRAELRLAIEAISSSLDDAGLPRAEVDGLVTFTMDEAPETELQEALGLGELQLLARVPYGGAGGCAAVRIAAMAVASGAARAVVVYRALRSSSGQRLGSPSLRPPPETGDQRWYAAFGLQTPVARVAITATRYLHRHRLEPDDFAQVALEARHHASTNPNAHFYERPLTLAEYHAAPWVAWPLRTLDCCQESDGAVALLVTSIERARDLRPKPAVVRAAAQSSGAGQGPLSQFWSEDVLRLPEVPGLRRQLEEQSGMSVTEVDAAMLYDHFSPLVLLQLEQMGFCADGGGSAFLAAGNCRLGGSLPMNTHGGHFGEAYLHGMNGIVEAVRQLRGSAVNQVDEVASVLVTSAASTPSSALILGKE